MYEGHSYPIKYHRIDIIKNVKRFRSNRIIQDLLTFAQKCDFDLNKIKLTTLQGKYFEEEYLELIRLIGYSISGYEEILFDQEGKNMGVLACDREGCENIMCDNFIKGRYICNDCLNEFKNFYNMEDKSEKEWIEIFFAFMESDKKLGSQKVMSWEEFSKTNKY